MKITAMTAAALTITASSLVLAVGAGASDAVVSVHGDYGDGGLIHCCIFGTEDQPTFITLPTWSSASTLSHGSEYGSAGLIQLGHGPGGPSSPTWSSASTLSHGSEYGSAELIQLGHGPGGPSSAPLGD